MAGEWTVVGLDSGVHTPGAEEAESPRGAEPRTGGRRAGEGCGREESGATSSWGAEGEWKQRPVSRDLAGLGMWGCTRRGRPKVPPTPVFPPTGSQSLCRGRRLGRDPRPTHMWGLAPAQEDSFVLKQIQFINNEIGTGIYLFMIAFKSPIRSYIYFSCQFAKNLLKVLLM